MKYTERADVSKYFDVVYSIVARVCVTYAAKPCHVSLMQAYVFAHRRLFGSQNVFVRAVLTTVTGIPLATGESDVLKAAGSHPVWTSTLPQPASCCGGYSHRIVSNRQRLIKLPFRVKRTGPTQATLARLSLTVMCSSGTSASTVGSGRLDVMLFQNASAAAAEVITVAIVGPAPKDPLADLRLSLQHLAVRQSTSKT